MVALPPGFEKVTACLQGDLLPAIALELPLEFMQPEAVIEPVVATMCTSCVVQDEVSGVTYIWRWSPPPWVKWPSSVPALWFKTPGLS